MAFSLFLAESVPPARRGGHDTGHDSSLIEVTEHVKKKCLYVNSWGASGLFAKAATPGLDAVIFFPLPLQLLRPHQDPTAGRAESKWIQKEHP